MQQSTKLFIDSSVWIAAFFKKDNRHLDGKAILEWMKDQQDYDIAISNLVLAEVLNFIQRKSYPEYAREIAKRIIYHCNVNVYFDDPHFFDQPLQVFNRFPALSYVDANILLFCRLLNCAYLISFDGNFDGIENIFRLENIDSLKKM